MPNRSMLFVMSYLNASGTSVWQALKGRGRIFTGAATPFAKPQGVPPSTVVKLPDGLNPNSRNCSGHCWSNLGQFRWMQFPAAARLGSFPFEAKPIAQFVPRGPSAFSPAGGAAVTFAAI